MLPRVSTQPYRCEACDVETTFVTASKFPENEPKEETFGVTWQCPGCHELSLDLCPIGPVEPVERSCLNCGKERDPKKPCPDCGMTKNETLTFLRIEDGAARTAEKADAAFEAGLYRHGFAVVNVLLQKNGKDAKLWETKGAHYQMLRLPKAALASYRRAIALAPNPLLEIAIAVAHAEDGAAAEAKAAYDALITRDEGGEARAIAHANRGNLHEAAGDVELAKADYEEAISRDPKRVAHYQNYSRLYTKRKRWDAAAAVVLRGLEAVTGEERYPLLVEKARIANEQELAEDALATADELLALAPEHLRGLYHRAWALGLMGRLDEAAEALEKLLDLDPTNKDGKKALDKIDAARRASREAAKKPWWRFW